MDEKLKKAYAIGVTVLVLLGVSTIVEYLIGSLAIGWWVPLVAIALLKAFFVVRDYMHLPRLFAGEEEVD